MPNIRISPKHGVNPTIPICFWCGKEKNEIALLGRISSKKVVKNAWDGTSTQITDSDMEAPKNMILDYEPCDECRANMSQGITLLACSNRPFIEGMPPVQTDPATGIEIYPQPYYAVVKPELIQELFVPEAAEHILEAGKAFIEKDDLLRIMPKESVDNRDA